jgi:hypothetical protein
MGFNLIVSDKGSMLLFSTYWKLDTCDIVSAISSKN